MRYQQLPLPRMLDALLAPQLTRTVRRQSSVQTRPPACPACGAAGVVDRPDLGALQATCTRCNWHYTVRQRGGDDAVPVEVQEEATVRERTTWDREALALVTIETQGVK